jgi:hypothetical protein
MPSEHGSSIGRFGLIAAGGYAFGPVFAAAGAVLGSFLFGASGPEIEGPRLGDTSVSASTYGNVIPVAFGVQKLAGSMIWATDIIEDKNTRTEGDGSDGPNIVSIDDLYVLDANTRLGQCRVSTLLPIADTADADWTPLGAGNHFAEVDDDNGDTSYIGSDTAGDLDMFDTDDLSFAPQTVHAVQISWRARKDDAATREVRSRIKSDAATANGATRTLTSS